jgi:8-oxo-dGTP pyrophosphatase MutT (NUDIX family)
MIKTKEPFSTDMRVNPPSPYHRGVRTHDAASLIIVRQDEDGPRVLMGVRHSRHRFMPGMVVFPGGKVDRCDFAAKANGELDETTRTLLVARMTGTARENRARALLLAAIRETFEETGLAIATFNDNRHLPPSTSLWHPFLKLDLLPDLGALQFIARAITPPGMVRRFDARFFLTNHSRIAASVKPESDELSHLEWLTVNQARTRNIPTITKIILNIVEHRLSLPQHRIHAEPVPFFRTVHGRREIMQMTVNT